MAKKLSEIYAPKSKDEKDFVAKHAIKKTTDKSPATKNADQVFKAANIKTFDRGVHRFGYDAPKDQKAYGNGKAPSPTDMKTSDAIAPYTIKIGEDVIVIKFNTETKKLEKQILKKKKGDASDDTQKSFKPALNKMKEEFEINDDNVDMLINLIDEYLLKDNQ